MSRPRTFISSTFYDLSDARTSIAKFLESIGHEPIFHEDTGFGVTPGRHSHEACIDQVRNADYFILLIGGRRGGTFVNTEKSITNAEYLEAVKRRIPVFIFVRKEVEQASSLFASNPQGNFSGVVDDIRVFGFIRMVRAQAEDNWIRKFETAFEVTEMLRSQFAYIHLIYSQNLVASRTPTKKREESARSIRPFPSGFGSIFADIDEDVATSLVDGFKLIHARVSEIAASGAQGVGEKLKTIWVIGRHGKLHGDHISIPLAVFKDFAFGTARLDRVITQLNHFGVFVSVDEDEDERGQTLSVSLSFGPDGESAAEALHYYIRDLIALYGEDQALDAFTRSDMVLYSDDSVAKLLVSRKELLKSWKKKGE